MTRSRDQQGRYISSSKNPHKDNIAGTSQEGKEHNQPNYLSPTTSYLAKMKPESSPLQSETIQGSLHEEIPILEEQDNEQHTIGGTLFPEVPERHSQKEMENENVKEEFPTFGFPIRESERKLR
jgi:hypothetical protein